MSALPSLLAALALAVPGYVEVANHRGTVVVRRQGASEIDLVAEGVIAAPPARIRALLLDYPRHPSFVRHLAESRVLSRTDEELLVYQRLSPPVIADRDVTLSVRWGEQGDVMWVHIGVANQRGPVPRRSIVRIPLDEGAWLLEPIDGGRATRVRFSLRLDLGGSLPRALARSRASGELTALFEAMRKLLR